MAGKSPKSHSDVVPDRDFTDPRDSVTDATRAAIQENLKAKRRPSSSRENQKEESVRERVAREKVRVGDRAAIISVKLPLAYLKILETEAALLRIPRSQFLSLLVAQKCDGFVFKRPPNAPEYSFSDRELQEAKLFLWYCEPKTREAVDRDRKQMGLSSFASWVNVILNHWIGRPGGLRSDVWRPGY
jgi:hypothetical protein